MIFIISNKNTIYYLNLNIIISFMQNESTAHEDADYHIYEPFPSKQDIKDQGDEYENLFQQPQPIPSQYVDQYNTFFDKFPIIHHIDKYQDSLKKHKISFLFNSLEKQLNFVIINKTKHSQVVTMTVSFSYFMFEISILNLAVRSFAKDLSFVGSGSYGKAHVCKLSKEQPSFIIKRINYQLASTNLRNGQNIELIRKKLRDSIKEYCLYKLFSAFEIGPKISGQLNFDIVAYRDGIQFAMETCKEALADFSSLDRDLCTSLKIMHMINIIHGDIKPQNIMWSPSYKKYVFIDFGLSTCLKQKIGQKSLTYFFGTYHYSGPEMKKILKQLKMGYADLYFNDLYGLELTLRDIKIMFIKKRKELDVLTQHLINEVIMDKDTVNHFLNIRLMGLIYERKLEGVEGFIENYKRIDIAQETISLILGSKVNFTLLKIATKIAENYILQENLKGKLQIFLQRKSQQSELQSKRMREFQNRIQQVITPFTGSINNIILFFLWYTGEDISPSAVQEKALLKSKILTSNPTNQNFWELLILFCSNCYTNTEQTLSIFEKVRLKLQMPPWENCYFNELNVYSQAGQIADIAWTKYKVNIFQLYNDQRQKRRAISERKEKYKDLITYIHDCPQIQDKLKRTGEHSIEYAQINPNKISSRYIQNGFLQEIINYDPAMRTYFSTEFRYQQIIKQTGYYTNKFQQLKEYLKFFSNSPNVCFDGIFYMRYQFHSAFFNLILRQSWKLALFRLQIQKFFNSKFKLTMKKKYFFNALISLLHSQQNILQDYKFDAELLDIENFLFNFIMNHLKCQDFSVDLFLYMKFIFNFGLTEGKTSRVNSVKDDLFRLKNTLKKDGKYVCSVATFTFINGLWTYGLIDNKQKYEMLEDLIETNKQDFRGKNPNFCYKQITLQFIEQSIYEGHDCQVQFNKVITWLTSQQNALIQFLYFPSALRVIGCYYATKKESSENKCIQLLLYLVERINKYKEKEMNFISWVSIKCLIQNFIAFTQEEKRMGLIISIYFYLKENLYLSREKQIQIYGNCVAIIDSLFIFLTKVSIQNQNQAIYVNLIKLASYLYLQSNFYYKHAFQSRMSYWMVDFINKKIFTTFNRRKIILFYLKLQRNSLYQIQFKQDSPPKLSDSKQATHRKLIQKKLQQKRQKIWDNKLSNMNIKLYSKLNQISIEYYYKQINSTIPLSYILIS